MPASLGSPSKNESLSANFFHCSAERSFPLAACMASTMDEAMHAAKGKDLSAEQWKKFAERLSFFEGDPNDAGMYPRLAKKVEEMSGSGASPEQRFYRFIPPAVP